MKDERPPPGADAGGAYGLGVMAVAVVGRLVAGALYWVGALGPLALGYVVVALFPVYLIVVAVVLSVWLGYDKDATTLRPVYKPK